jgi:uncharacterized membrane protein YtjA (UPF0391 family)
MKTVAVSFATVFIIVNMGFSHMSTASTKISNVLIPIGVVILLFIRIN